MKMERKEIKSIIEIDGELLDKAEIAFMYYYIFDRTGEWFTCTRLYKTTPSPFAQGNIILMINDKNIFVTDIEKKGFYIAKDALVENNLLPQVCTCGAVKSGNPNCHSDWCDSLL